MKRKTIGKKTSKRPRVRRPAGVEGIFLATNRGFGFVRPDDGEKDLFIPPRSTRAAWNGDRVLARPIAGHIGQRAAAEVEKIIARGNVSVVGELIESGGGLVLKPDDRKLDRLIELNRPSPDLRAGTRAAADIDDYGDELRAPRGHVVRLFGPADGREAACKAVLYQRGIEPEFPEKVLLEAERIPPEPEESALSGRRDLREELIFTIDGTTAKDFDDAVSLSRDGESFVLGVHIADVSHYVSKGTLLDAEAYKRGTSVYYADRVIPMLPERLSNGACSLNEGVNRLTVTARMWISPRGKTLKAEFYPSVIRSRARMTYENCNAMLAGDKALRKKYSAIMPVLTDMAELYRVLYRMRMARGALDLTTVEGEVRCDELGYPIDVLPRNRGSSERIIEEFMIAANEAVAELTAKKNLPTLYRVHPKPDPDKLAAFGSLAARLGYTLPSLHSRALQSVLDACAGRDDSRILNTALLRSMAKAVYSAGCDGHYGLAAKYYCHFTSPIRRYPDLVMHRCLKAELAGGGLRRPADYAFAEEAAARSTEREIAADEAERETEKRYKAEYMKSRLGERFTGFVSGVQNYGLFIELENTAEGLLPIEELPGDVYTLSGDGFTLAGVNTGSAFSLGQKMEVFLLSADEVTGQINFTLKCSDRA